MVAAAIEASNGNGEACKKSKFSTSFVAEYAGINNPNPCDSSIMTPFYRGLEEHKGNKAAARKLVETCFGPKSTRSPDAPREMTSVLSTETMSAFRNGDFTAGAAFVACEERLNSVVWRHPGPHYQEGPRKQSEMYGTRIGRLPKARQYLAGKPGQHECGNMAHDTRQVGGWDPPIQTHRRHGFRTRIRFAPTPGEIADDHAKRASVAGHRHDRMHDHDVGNSQRDPNGAGPQTEL